MTPREIIQRKKEGRELTREDLRFLCRGVVQGTIPDYQVAAWLMAVCFRGMSEEETLALTLEMVATGETLDWSHLPRSPVDKHSTGGVGDKTSLVLVPLLAALGVPFVKMSGRGLGHTGGTLDKLESIPGFRVDLSPSELREQVGRIGCALVGQSPGLVPADGILYALRDVTATVDSVPLIASSIMSKKLAAGARTIVLDVKYGTGAFMGSLESARDLARAMVRIGTGAGRNVAAVLSAMDEPLGCAVGHALEVGEAIDTLRGEGPEDLWRLASELGAQVLVMAGDAPDAAAALALLPRARDSGAALNRLEMLVEAQGGDTRAIRDPSVLPRAPVIAVETAGRAGWVERVDALGVAEAALRLGAGRLRKGDAVDPAVGIRLLKKRGSPLSRHEPIAEIHARTDADAEAARAVLGRAIAISEGEVHPVPPVSEVVTARG
jgi:pyrimidine-nucleoside phosphorylase